MKRKHIELKALGLTNARTKKSKTDTGHEELEDIEGRQMICFCTEIKAEQTAFEKSNNYDFIMLLILSKLTDMEVQMAAREWLVHGRMPDDMVVAKWKACFKLRQRDIKSNTQLADVLNLYPILKHPVGGSLVSRHVHLNYILSSEANRDTWVELGLIMVNNGFV